MEKFTTIAAICGLALALALVGPARADCLKQMDRFERLARSEPDWLRREILLAILTEARRDASRGSETGCLEMLGRARAQLRDARR